MKRFLYLTIICISSYSCNFLEITPTNMLSEEAVKNDPVLVNAYLTQVYRNIRWQSGNRAANGNYGGDNTERNMALLGVVGGELNVYAAWQDPFQAAIHIMNESGAHPSLDYWPYDNIRSTNEIIEILKEATFDPNLIKQKTAEARWLRAFMYFELVKRYGGVPLITTPQSVSDEELSIPRNTEKEIYDFIASEMDEIVNILPNNYPTEYGRPTKWAAYALKSRAMLYAGSIAKYGKIQMDGLLGIPAAEAANYFKKSYDAAMEIINNSPHPLYKGIADPVKNFGAIHNKDNNPEVIFAEVWDYPLLKMHSWNSVTVPGEVSAARGGNPNASNHQMYLESFEKFEYKDGRSGKLDWNDLKNNTKFSLKELILDKDPRCLATACYPEMLWDGTIKIYFHAQTIGTIPAGSTWPSTATARNRQVTGFLVRKRVDEAAMDLQYPRDGTDWIVFRTGEMYLNAAEAAYERGDVGEAKRLINLLRNRAGMPAKGDNLTIDDIRNERFVELFNEEHRYWDLRRWRTAVAELNGKGFHGVTWRYYIAEDKYTLELRTGTPDFNAIRTFSDRNYYMPIGQGRIAASPKLVENPGYMEQ